MSRTPEGRVKDKIKLWLKSLPHCWFFCPYMAGFGTAGVPDIVGLYKGHFFAIEVKAPGKLGNVTLLQRKCLDAINQAGGLAFVTDDLDSCQLYFLGQYAV